MRLRFPHPLTLLVGFIALVAVLSWVLPAGQFERRDDPVTGRRVVVAGTYHSVPQQPVTPLGASYQWRRYQLSSSLPRDVTCGSRITGNCLCHHAI
jgi:uncharacterized ion transporter superfamily protein YfcC